MMPVETPIARDSSDPEDRAISMAISVARDAINVLTKLFPTRIATRSLSVFVLSFCKVRAQSFFFFTRASILWVGRDIIAISEPEKKAEKNSKITNSPIVKGSIIINKIKCSIMKYRKNKEVYSQQKNTP